MADHSEQKDQSNGSVPCLRRPEGNRQGVRSYPRGVKLDCPGILRHPTKTQYLILAPKKGTQYLTPRKAMQGTPPRPAVTAGRPRLRQLVVILQSVGRRPRICLRIRQLVARYLEKSPAELETRPHAHAYRL